MITMNPTQPPSPFLPATNFLQKEVMNSTRIINLYSIACFPPTGVSFWEFSSQSCSGSRQDFRKAGRIETLGEFRYATECRDSIANHPIHPVFPIGVAPVLRPFGVEEPWERPVPKRATQTPVQSLRPAHRLQRLENIELPAFASLF